MVALVPLVVHLVLIGVAFGDLSSLRQLVVIHAAEGIGLDVGLGIHDTLDKLLRCAEVVAETKIFVCHARDSDDLARR